MHDEQLRKALAKWEAPVPSARLDRRVFDTCRPPARVSWKLWGAVAAGVAVMLGANLFRPAAHLDTTLGATGFRPIPDGAVTVVKAGAKP